MQSNQTKKRLHFIDASRAVAILMMLQGHFVYAMLAQEYHNQKDTIYSTWEFFRGITAPLFFTVSGMIFVYLLVRHNLPFLENPRVIKGFKRGFYLIFWGYLLRTNFLGIIFRGKLFPSFWQVDVLHCIGIGILVLLIIFWIKSVIKVIPVSYYYGLASLAIFIYEPVYSNFDYSGLPHFLQNYLTTENGSVFTVLPWIGYTLLGGVFGYIFRKYEKIIRTWWFPLCFIAFGLIMNYFSGHLFIRLYRLTEYEVFKDVAYNTTRFIRLGHVFVALGLFMWCEKLLEKGAHVFLRIGQETLLIYQVHYIVLYGSWFGLGISKFWGKSLSPIGVATGALMFMIAHILLIKYLDEISLWLKNIFHRIKLFIKPLLLKAYAFILTFLKKLFLRLKKER